MNAQPEGFEIPLTDVLGDRNAPVKIEESWSKDVPADGGGIVDSFNRMDAIEAAVRLREKGKSVQSEEIVKEAKPIKTGLYHFFVYDGKKLEFIGSKNMVDAERFAKDISGRMFREWMKREFPNRHDYMDIVCWNDLTTVKEVVDLVGMVEK